MNAEGNDAGTVQFYNENKVETVGGFAKVKGLPAGFHGFHVHETGECKPDFTAAEGHLNPEGRNHSEHPGDMPVLLVNKDRTGSQLTN